VFDVSNPPLVLPQPKSVDVRPGWSVATGAVIDCLVLVSGVAHASFDPHASVLAQLGLIVALAEALVAAWLPRCCAEVDMGGCAERLKTELLLVGDVVGFFVV
jgi:hypothetical protein